MRKKLIPKPPKTDEEAYQRLLALHGYSKTRIAKMLGISKQAITRWTVVPLKHVKALSDATGIPRADLRPSDYA